MVWFIHKTNYIYATKKKKKVENFHANLMEINIKSLFL